MSQSLPNDTLNPSPFRKEFKTCLSELAKMRSFVSTTLDNYRLKSQIQEDLTLAIDEAFTNIICHGHDNCAELDIKISLQIIGSQLNVTIFDKGIAFDINAHPMLNLEHHLHTYKKGGLGIHIIRQLVDNIEYTPADSHSKENKLVLTKNLSS